MLLLRQSTTATVQIGPFVDSGDGDTEEGSLTISQADVRLSKNGGDIAQKNDATSCTYDELGLYSCPLNATDTGTLGRLQLWVHESGALHVAHEYMVIPANVYDALVLGTDKLDANVAEISEDSTAADNAESFFDGTGYAGTNNVIPTVTTLTGHTAQTGDSYARLGAPVGSSISDDIATVDGNVDDILVDTNELQTDWTNAGRLDALLDAVKAVTDMLSPGAQGIFTGTVATGNTAATTTTFSATGITETTADHFLGRNILFYNTGDPLKGQMTDITDYAWDAGNSEAMFTFSTLTDTPTNGELFVIL